MSKDLLLFNKSIATYHQLPQLIQLLMGGPLPQAPVVGLQQSFGHIPEGPGVAAL